MKLILLPEAKRDLQDAQEWYEAQKRGLGLALRDELEVFLAALRTVAHRGEPVPEGGETALGRGPGRAPATDTAHLRESRHTSRAEAV